MSVSYKTIVLGLVSFFSIHGSVLAQTQLVNHSEKASGDGTMEVSEKPATAAPAVTNSAVLNLFTQLFPEAQEVKWSPLAVGSVVNFQHNGQKGMAGFDPKGKLNYIITTLSREQLPTDLAREITASYADYQLISAREVKAFGEIACYAILESANDFVTLKQTRDGVEMEQRRKK